MTSEQETAIRIERQLGNEQGYEDGRKQGQRDAGSANGPHAGIVLNWVGDDDEWVKPDGGVYWEEIAVHRSERCALLATLDTPYSEGYVGGYTRGYRMGVLDAYHGP